MTTIITDSTADLSPEMAAAHGIHVVPLHVTINNQTFMDGVDIVMPKLFSLVAQTGKLPQTAAPSVGTFTQTFSLSGDIIFISISSQLSACYNNALLAAQDEAGKRIRLIDSLNISSGIALLALRAVQLDRQGVPAAEIESAVRALVPKVRTLILLDTLEYVYKGGRVSAIQHLAGSLLKIRPILEVCRDGTIDSMENTRGTRRKSLDSLLGIFEKDLPLVDLQHIFVTHAGCYEDAAYLVDGIKQCCTPIEVTTALTGTVISSHGGPGTIGIIYLLK